MLTLLSSMAPKDVIAKVVTLYQRTSNVALNACFDGGVDVARRVQSGESIDITVLSRDAIDKLIASASVFQDGVIDLMASGIGVAVQSGTHRPAFDDEACVRRAVLNAETLSYSTGPSGRYLAGLFERWGILPAIGPRIIVPPSGVAVARLIARGEVALGFQQMSELINVSGISVIGPLPPTIQLMTTFTAAIGATCQNKVVAADFIRFLASPSVDEIKRQHGMQAVR